MRAFNDRFGLNISETALKGKCTNMGLKAPGNGKFSAGYTPWNKGMKGLRVSMRTEFSAHNRPHNALPVGSERIKGDGYWYVKIAEPNTWKTKHQIIWEAANGPKPKNKKLIFLDGNVNNFALSNLHLVSSAELLQLNRNEYKQAHTDLKPAVLAVSKLESAIYAARSKRKGQHA